ncbi:hypothetical protein BU23DRAFT_575439 [Bimuria novae-zelandiae CBS 107.79]|uniref:Uncharacterized protein n=1 Tax=Bimuria novae-zelandiae CBS 107.79 TaxID=1447943 RepID=A0A6A5ULW3_9PLEO|nr:hypothetical protein BU23DRAFT_575439 [Bimuria novae-zelandiae CBS 107.79]
MPRKARDMTYKFFFEDLICPVERLYSSRSTNRPYYLNSDFVGDELEQGLLESHYRLSTFAFDDWLQRRLVSVRHNGLSISRYMYLGSALTPSACVLGRMNKALQLDFWCTGRKKTVDIKLRIVLRSPATQKIDEVIECTQVIETETRTLTKNGNRIRVLIQGLRLDMNEISSTPTLDLKKKYATELEGLSILPLAGEVWE